MRELQNTTQDIQQDTQDEVMMVFRAHYEELKAFVQRCAFEHSPNCADEELALWFELDKRKAQAICIRNKWEYEVDPEALEEDEEESDTEYKEDLHPQCAHCDTALQQPLKQYPGNIRDGLYCSGGCYDKDHPEGDEPEPDMTGNWMKAVLDGKGD